MSSFEGRAESPKMLPISQATFSDKDTLVISMVPFENLADKTYSPREIPQIISNNKKR